MFNTRSYYEDLLPKFGEPLWAMSDYALSDLMIAPVFLNHFQSP